MEIIVYNGLARIYDTLIAEDIDYNKWSEAILDICNKYNIKFDNYCDLACGTGNISILIAPKFKMSYCVDLSEEMLMEAQQKFIEKRLKGKFILQDMSKLNLNNKFSLVTCATDGINYLLEDEQTDSFLNGVYNVLEDEGIFIFDINSKYKLTELLGNNQFTYNSDDVVYIWENTCDNNTVKMDITFFVNDEDDMYERIDENHEEKIIEEKFIEDLIYKNNFKIEMKIDNYSISEGVNNKTERITYVLRKK